MVRENDGSFKSLPAYQAVNGSNSKKDVGKTDWSPKFRRFSSKKRNKRNSQIKVMHSTMAFEVNEILMRCSS